MNTIEPTTTTTTTLLGEPTTPSAPRQAVGFYDVIAQLTLQQKRERQQRNRAR